MGKIINKICQSLRRVALYLRLSKEDLDKLSPEERSESIKNQERMLRDKAEEEGWQIVDVYIDEDYSGADANRPEFNRMLKDCEDGKIDIVLCKSQSRFSRDMELVEKYIHNKFIEWNVRFVSLVDNADTENKGNKKSRQINGLVNEWYLEDTSDNIKATLKSKKEAGLYTGSFAPYGYMKDVDDKNHLVIDPVASEVVKKIFELYNNGYGYYKIVNYLNQEKIPCPYDYKKKQGCKMASPSTKKRQSITSVSKKGGYIIFNTIENEELEKVTNVTSVGMLTASDTLGQTIRDNIDLSVRKLDKGMRIFSSSVPNQNIDLNNLLLENNTDWQELKVGELIPKDTLYIAVMVAEIRRINNVSYELEAIVNSNDKNPDYHYLATAICDGNKKLNYYSRYEKKPGWSDRTIAEMLRNQVYIGNLVQGKYKNISYKNQKSRHTSKDEWIIVENTHDPIIEKDIWYSVQMRLQSSSRTDTITGEINPLSKKVYCSVCGKSFEKTNGSGHKHEYLVCRDKRTKWLNCDNRNSVRFDRLEEKVISEINNFLQCFRDGKILKNLNEEIIDKNLFKDKINALKKELQDNENQMVLKDKYFQQLYEDRVNQIINESQFYSLSQRYNEDVKKLQERQKAIKVELDMVYSQQSKLRNTDELFTKYEKVDKLTIEISNEWIDKILIGKVDDDGISRDIQILWNF